VIHNKSFQALPIRPSGHRAAQYGNLWPTREFPPRSRESRESQNGGPDDDRDEAMSKRRDLEAALTLLTSENQVLQATLEAERKYFGEMCSTLENLRQAANTDPLTGLFNRRSMDQQLNALLLRQGNPALSVLMLDIDHFKRINDTYGHPNGDKVIREVAETLRRCLRAEDTAFRYGGEEFMVLLPNTPLEGAINVAESIRGRVEAMHMSLHEDAAMQCTVSLGVASRVAQDDRESLCRRADRALYQAKNQGRNRVAHESG
jgi:diguanylate cyclase (GGDEF)-like protein